MRVEWVGSVRAVTDAQGQIIARHDLLPFGEELAAQNPPRDRKLFTGQERDFETGLDYFHARQLRVDLGRFTAPDPLTNVAWTDPTRGASSTYGYVWNNPLGFVDPSGMEGDQAYEFHMDVGDSFFADQAQYDNILANSPGTMFFNGVIYCQGKVVGTYCSIGGTCDGGGGTGGFGGSYRDNGAGGGGGGQGTAPSNGNQSKPIDWKKVGSCLVDSTLNHYGLTAAAGASGALAIPISKSLVPPYRMIGEPTTNLLSVLGHYVEINVPGSPSTAWRVRTS
jgi:RHS repeat-associated protein